jgi:hypothetical protein
LQKTGGLLAILFWALNFNTFFCPVPAVSGSAALRPFVPGLTHPAASQQFINAGRVATTAKTIIFDHFNF